MTAARRARWSIGVLATLVALAARPAAAAETGSVSGRVVAADGQPLAAVTVTVAGDPLPAGRTAPSRSDGTFAFVRLPPGSYRVTAALAGVGRAEREAVVAVDRDTQLELLLAPASGEQITVEVARPVIDTRASEVSTSATRPRLESLPLERSYRGLLALAPGVGENGRQSVNAGGSRMDNTYLLDGVNLTNPFFGDIMPEVNELDVAEVDLERGGISAEEGRTGGMIVNAVTRSGGNDLDGSVRLEHRPSSWSAPARGPVQAQIDREGIAANLGGPVLRDHAWFYGSGNFPRTTATDRRNNVGAIPDLEVRTHEGFLKLTAAPQPTLYLAAGLRLRKATTDNANITANAHPSVATDDSTDDTIGTFDGTWSLDASHLLEARYDHDEQRNHSRPLTDLGYRPVFDAAHPELMGQFTTTPDRIVGGATGVGQLVGGAPLLNQQDYRRDQARVVWQSFQQWFGHDHDVRAGISWERGEERLERQANGWGTVNWSPTFRTFTASYYSIQPPHTARTETQGVFAQDQITLSPRATLTAGLLADQDAYYGESNGATPGTKVKTKILTFDWQDQLQPRLGFSFVPRPSLGDHLYAALGRYANTENKSLARAASPTRVFTTRATFDAAGNLLSEVRAANTQSKTIDPGLRPMKTDEIVAGYARPLGHAWSGELSGIHREVKDIFEDVSADGLGNGPFHVAQLPDARRRYSAATLSLRRTPVDASLHHLWVDASYTWSRLSGNWDIDYSASDSLFYNSSIIEDGPGVLLTDDRDGLLRGDRTHVLKVFAAVEPAPRLRTGGYLRFQSGGAWEARGLPSPNVSSSSYVRYLEPAGSRRMPDWWNLDLLASYALPLGPTSVELEARVLNVFDTQVALQVDDRYALGQSYDPAHPVPPVGNNPTFGQATVVSAPRSFVLSATVRF